MNHTDYSIEVRTIDGSTGTIDREGGEHAFAQVQIVDPRLVGGDLQEANRQRGLIAARMVACWNAFVGVETPRPAPDYIDLFRIIRAAGRSDRAKAEAVARALGIEP